MCSFEIWVGDPTPPNESSDSDNTDDELAHAIAAATISNANTTAAIIDSRDYVRSEHPGTQSAPIDNLSGWPPIAMNWRSSTRDTARAPMRSNLHTYQWSSREWNSGCNSVEDRMDVISPAETMCYQGNNVSRWDECGVRFNGDDVVYPDYPGRDITYEHPRRRATCRELLAALRNARASLVHDDVPSLADDEMSESAYDDMPALVYNDAPPLVDDDVPDMTPLLTPEYLSLMSDVDDDSSMSRQVHVEDAVKEEQEER
ncbi:hypothetical protein ACLMJK_003258 [Lecanora helva]